MRLWRVRDVMTTDVVSVDEWAPYRDIVDLLTGCRISGVPVIDYFGHVTGVVSEADLLHRVEAGGARQKATVFDGRRVREAKTKAAGVVAGDLMTAPAVTVMAETPLSEAAKLMDHEGVKRLPVVDDLGRLIGVVTRGDVLRVYLRGDAEIRDDVVTEVFKRVLALEPGTVEATVTGGIVELAGEVDRRTVAELAVRLTRTVPGVIDVVDKMTFDFDDGELARWDPHGHPFDAELCAPRAARR